jgi:hypothetical protein
MFQTVRALRALAAGCLMVAATAPHSAAQQAVTGGAISGRVLDATGGAIGGASVAVRDRMREQTRTTATDERGRFQLLFLPVGDYDLAVEADGFARRTFQVTVAIGQTVDVPITLTVAGVSTAVEVAARAVEIDTRRTQAADTIRPAEVDSLPLNGRNYLDLALLVPGVSRTVQRNTERFAETSAVPGTGISVAGQRNLNNTFIVDGLSANDDAAGLAGTYFAEDVIREFQVVTSGGIAEFGRASSGIVNIVTQSGANERRGRAYGFFRDDALDARNPLATREDPVGLAQYGLTLSGPVARNRTFWFANVERTDLARTGLVTIQPGTVTAVNDFLDTTGYGGPRLATGEFPTGYETTNVFGRVDHALAGATRLTARYGLYDVSSDNARTVGGLNAESRGTRLDNRDHTAAATLLWSRSPASFNELRAQATWSRLDAPGNDLVGPAVGISGTANFGASSSSPTVRDLDVFEIADSYTRQARSHLVKVGVQLLYERLTIGFPGALRGTYTFQSLAAFRTGTYVNYQQAFGEPFQFQTNPNLGVFVQDEWRPRHDLTVNAGLRYDLQWLQDPVGTDTNNVSPRLGVAWAPGDGRTVVRASGGVYYDRIPLRAVSNALQRDGSKYRVALVSFGQAGAPVFPDVMATFPSQVVSNVTTIDPAIRNGVARQANVQVERQIARGLRATAGYAYLAGRRIIMSTNVNVPTLTAAEAAAQGIPNLGRPDPTIGNNARFQSLGTSDYDGLTLAVHANARRIGTLRLSYTLSKAMDDAGNAFFSSPQDNFDIAADYGRSDNDQRHRLVVSGTAPTFYGFQFSYLFGYASAPPFNIQTGGDRNNDTNVNDRPAGEPRNSGGGFDSATFDLRLSRAIHIGSRQRVDLILDAFNVFNRTNFLIPNNIIGTGAVPSPTLGRPTAAGDPRQIQVGVRWTL